jgi:two-component sensor histidine kinase
VLAASELVVNALSHALNGEAAGWIAVTLCRIGPDAASLSVADNGRGLPCLWNRPTGIIADLAGLLGSEVVYRAREGGGTLAQIGFSLQA